MSMSNADNSRHPLYKLEAWSAPLLLMDDPGLHRRFIEVAENESPTQTFKIVEALMKLERYGNGERKSSDEEARKMAQAAHWLSMVRRDYGSAEFDRLVTGRR